MCINTFQNILVYLILKIQLYKCIFLQQEYLYLSYSDYELLLNRTQR